MGHACAHHHDHHGGDQEHPVVAVIAVVAIVAAMLLIAVARLAVHGTEDLEAALIEPAVHVDLPIAPRTDPKPHEEREVDAAVTASRFATGFSP
jgi:hypothetical protein